MDDRTNSATMNAHEQATDLTSMHQPLAKFTVFPKLPPELRQKIFKDALPSSSRGYRTLSVYGTVIVPDQCKNPSTKKSKSKPKPNSEAYIEFTLLRNSGSNTAKDLALSRSCTESRAVFLKRNPYTLITEGEGLIRFAKDDIIHLSNYRDFSHNLIVIWWDCLKLTIPKPAIPMEAILDVSTIRGTHARPVFEARSKIGARMNLMFLSKFEGVGVLGLVLDTAFYYIFGEDRERFIDAALNSREEVHAFLKGALHWADDDLPEVHILNSQGDRLERSQ